jgi:hypothetical protein
VNSAAGSYTGPDGTFTTLGIPAPVVGTGGASAIGQGQATLSGSVDPRGWDTTYRFEYGMSTAYGASWPTVAVDLGGLTGAQSVSVTVQNLLPGTTYHYRLVASNTAGTIVAGEDQTFTTSSYPVSVVQQPLLLAGISFPGASPAKAKPKVLKRKAKSKKHKKPTGKHKGRKH